MNEVPFVDLAAENQQILDEVRKGFERLIASSHFILGSDVTEFEAQFSKFLRVKHCIGVGNGTDALELILRASGIGPGDEVVLPANTFIATALAVRRAGARPVLVDCDPDYHLIDPEAVAARLGSKTKAIIPVHLYGQLAPMETLRTLVEDREIVIVEDAAQAHGASRNAQNVGALGTAAATSFYPSKNLGAFGDGGAVITNSDAIDQKVRALRNYGSDVKYHHPELGFNSRLDTLQAIVLKAKLRLLSSWNEQRQIAAQRYYEMLAGVSGVQLPQTMPGNEHVWHLYVIRVTDRDKVSRRLRDMNIGTGIHYPMPIHMLGAFRYLGYARGDFPVSEQAATEVLSLPMYPTITVDQQAQVVEALRRAL